MKLKEIFAVIAALAILALLVKLAFFRDNSGGGEISYKTQMKLDSLQRSTGELIAKNAALEEKIRALEDENTRLEQSKVTVKNNYTQKKNSFEKLKEPDRETEFKNYIKNANPELYRKLYGDK